MTRQQRIDRDYNKLRAAALDLQARLDASRERMLARIFFGVYVTESGKQIPVAMGKSADHVTVRMETVQHGS